MIAAAPLCLVPGSLYRLGGVIALDGDVNWLTPDARGFQHLNCYLVLEPSMTTLIDTGLPSLEREIVDQLLGVYPKQLPLNVFMTRSEYESVGNLEAIQNAAPIQSIVAGGKSNNLDGFTEVVSFVGMHGRDVQRAVAGRPLAGSERLEVIRPPLRALNATSWVYDRMTKTLFTSDTFSYLTVPSSDSSPILDAGRDTSTFELAKATTHVRFEWLADARTATLQEALHQIFEREIDVIAPTHGCIIKGRSAVAKHYAFLDRILAEANPAAGVPA